MASRDTRDHLIDIRPSFVEFSVSLSTNQKWPFSSRTAPNSQLGGR